MGAVKARDVEAAIRNRRPDIQLLLVYGPDAGRAAELARTAAAGFVEDPSDALQLVRFDGDRVAETPGSLVEEATTFGLFGGRRAVWVRPTTRSIVSAVNACLEVALSETLVVVEAGDLGKAHPLRLACEASPRALALPCYRDEGRDLETLVSSALAASGLTIEPEARALLVDALGGDRLASRTELGKLALYVHPRTVVTAADVEAAVSDVSATTFDAVLDAAFLGQPDALQESLAAVAGESGGLSSLMVLSVRHALALLAARSTIEAGQSVDEAIRAWRGLHFRRTNTVAAQLRLWTSPRLRMLLADLQAATLDGRRSPAITAIGPQALLRIAAEAGRQAAARNRRQSASS